MSKQDAINHINQLVKDGQKLGLVKLVKESTGLHLRECKELVDKHWMKRETDVGESLYEDIKMYL